MDRASARQNFDGNVMSSGDFSDAIVRNRKFTIQMSDQMEHYGMISTMRFTGFAV